MLAILLEDRRLQGILVNAKSLALVVDRIKVPSAGDKKVVGVER